jgi:methylated-DNA-[protein]-cysteine S-methyltransferase
MSQQSTIIDSPIGPLRLDADGGGMTSVWMGAEGSAEDKPEDPVLRRARDQLEAYFAGDLTEFDLPLAPVGTAFQHAVWDLLLKIPFGTTTSYGALAHKLGKPGAMRAVGLANGRNPLAIIVPCHRVIGADGSLTGYGGGLERKRWLLEHEGAATPPRGFTDHSPADERTGQARARHG